MEVEESEWNTSPKILDQYSRIFTHSLSHSPPRFLSPSPGPGPRSRSRPRRRPGPGPFHGLGFSLSLTMTYFNIPVFYTKTTKFLGYFTHFPYFPRISSEFHPKTDEKDQINCTKTKCTHKITLQFQHSTFTSTSNFPFTRSSPILIPITYTEWSIPFSFLEYTTTTI